MFYKCYGCKKDIKADFSELYYIVQFIEVSTSGGRNQLETIFCESCYPAVRENLKLCGIYENRELK